MSGMNMQGITMADSRTLVIRKKPAKELAWVMLGPDTAALSAGGVSRLEPFLRS